MDYGALTKAKITAFQHLGGADLMLLVPVALELVPPKNCGYFGVAFLCSAALE